MDVKTRELDLEYQQLNLLAEVLEYEILGR